jgi:hypothetical protein
MTSLHDHLQRGHSLAAAMCSVRRELIGDAVQQAAARSLIALGAV